MSPRLNAPVPSAPMGIQVEKGSSVDELLKEIVIGGFRRLFLVTGDASFRWFHKKGLVSKLSEVAEVAQFSGVRPNVTFDYLADVLLRAESYKPDAILGVGGGSALDLAKVLAAYVGQAERPSDYDASVSLARRSVALILVPTTAGTGAEATSFATAYKGAEKFSISGNALLCDKSILDPAPVMYAPADQLAASALDALTQCIESIWARSKTQSSERYAIKGLQLILENIVNFVRGDFSRTPQMQLGAHLSGHAINISKTTAPHALSYHLTMKYGLSHGVAVASTLGTFIDHHNDIIRAKELSELDPIRTSMQKLNALLGLRGPGDGQRFMDTMFTDLGLSKTKDYWPSTSDAVVSWIRSANHQRMSNHPVSIEQGKLFQILSK